jgi:hypothetical protein
MSVTTAASLLSLLPERNPTSRVPQITGCGPFFGSAAFSGDFAQTDRNEKKLKKEGCGLRMGTALGEWVGGPSLYSAGKGGLRLGRGAGKKV